ncbi:MAG: hypothetical protein ACFCBV_00210 [Phycisphaerales bacterium]
MRSDADANRGRSRVGRAAPLVVGLVAACVMLAGLSIPWMISGPPAGGLRATPDDLDALRAKSDAQLSSTDGRRSTVRLYFKTGRFIDGELVTETIERVTLRIAGVERQFTQRQIDRLVRLPDLATRYRQWRAEISDSDVGHIEQLIQWLVSQELYHVAHYEAVLLRGERPRDPRVATLVRQMRGVAELYDQRGQGVEREPGEAEKPLPLLTAEQVNLIRLFEIDLLDPPRVRIDASDAQEFLLAYRDDPRVPPTPEGRQALMAGDPLDIVRLMFELKAREFYGRVRVLDDPEVMRRFRQDVTGWLVVGCATSRCHGGAEAGRLRLAHRNPRGEAQAYTNFYILTRATLEDGTPLSDLEEPENSPLLQLGLRRNGARFPHPEVPSETGLSEDWRPVFGRAGDVRWRETTAWIRSLYQPRPAYPIVYPPDSGDRDGPQTADEGPGEPQGVSGELAGSGGEPGPR